MSIPTLRHYQKDAVDKCRASLSSGKKYPLLVLPTGGGKCLGKGTKILMFNGDIRSVEDVKKGDLIMGPDSKPRKVLSICNGTETLYKIIPTKGESFIVNESHILSLRMTNSKDRVYLKGVPYQDGEIANVPILDYLKSSLTFKHRAKTWRVGVEFTNRKELDFDPYLLGLWLGDGASRVTSFSSIDPEIVSAIYDYANKESVFVREEHVEGKCPIYIITGKKKTGRKGGGNPMMDFLKKNNLIQNKHVPNHFLVSSTENRLKLIAGLIDTDGHLHHSGYDFISKSKQLADDITFLCRSVGLAAYIKPCKKKCTNNGVWGDYFRVSISGDCDRIPCRIARKKCQKRRQIKNVLNTGFKVEKLEEGEYFGFEIDGDRLFMLGDFTVTHNTVVFSYITSTVVSKSKSVLILAHRSELLRQGSTALDTFDVWHGVISPDFTPDLMASVQVASVQTMNRRMQKYNFNPDLIIIDEAHHATSKSYRAILDYFPSARILGVTATPVRSDGKGLGLDAGGIFDDLIIGPSVEQLIAEGFLAKPVIYAPLDRIDMSSVKKSMGDYDKTESVKLIDKSTITGDAVDHYLKICPNTPAVVFCINLAHSEHVVDEFRSRGISCESIDGEMDRYTRKAILDRFSSGETLVLVSVDLIGEGFDLPKIGCAILLRPTASLGLFLQQVGRALRPVEGKEFAYILDHVGNVITHGLPEEEREWTLDGEVKDKKSKKEKEKRVRIFQCQDCYCMHAPAPSCPQCGFIYVKEVREIKKTDGDLQMVTQSDRDLLRRNKAKEIGKACTFDELKQLEIQNGYKDGWAKHVFASRTKKEINL